MSAEHETTLEQAMQGIQSDQERIALGTGETTTRQQVYDRYLGTVAREGETIVEEGRERHIPGLYDRYATLTHEQIDRLLEPIIIQLATAGLGYILHIGSFIEGTLRQAKWASERANIPGSEPPTARRLS